MPYFYIRNTTTKTQEFHWPTSRGAYDTTLIHAGMRALIGNDALAMGQIEQIIAAHKQYGLIAAADLPKGRPYIGLSYEIVDEALPDDAHTSQPYWVHLPSLPASAERDR